MSSQTKIDGSEQSNSVVRSSKQLQLGLKLTFSTAVTLFMNPYCKEKRPLNWDECSTLDVGCDLRSNMKKLFLDDWSYLFKSHDWFRIMKLMLMR